MIGFLMVPRTFFYFCMNGLMRTSFVEIDTLNSFKLSVVKHFRLFTNEQSGAPNESIVQNHLNIAFLNVF